MVRVSAIVGTGSYLPGKPITNDDLADLFGPGIKTICKNIGVHSRHWAIHRSTGWKRDGTRNSFLAAEAARRAIQNAELKPEDIGLLLMVTATPDFPFPATVTFVQELLGIEECMTLEFRAACAGVAQAMSVADCMIKSGQISNAVIIGSELSSCFSNFDEARDAIYRWPPELLLSTVMFGDGAGAIAISAQEGSTCDGIFATAANSVGNGKEPGFGCQYGGSVNPVAPSDIYKNGGLLVHEYRSIINLGPKLVLRAFNELSSATQLGINDFDVILPPQANPQLTLQTLSKEGIDPGLVFFNVDQVGNTSSASLLIALDELNKTSRLRKGDCIAVLAAEASKWLYGYAGISWAI